MTGHLFRPSARMRPYLESVWSSFTVMANQYQAVNLGQGFPNFKAPDYVKKAACDAIQGDLNQYVHTLGIPHLRKAISDSFSESFHRILDVDKEILISQGAQEGTFAALQAIVGPEEEVVLMEPFYDMYESSVTMPHGKAIYFPLTPPENNKMAHSSEWSIDLDGLRSIISPKTRAILINTPHNPIGKVFSQKELEGIAKIATEKNLIVISDEVYDRLVYDKIPFVRIASLPGMWQRTLTIGSAGKTFAVTGWRVGWVIGPESILKYVSAAHNKIAFCVAAPLQEAIALGFEQEKEHAFFDWQLAFHQKQRNKLAEVLTQVGLPFILPEGSYFILVNIDSLKVPQNFDSGSEIRKDWRACLWLIKEIGVAAIPFSIFFSSSHAKMGENYIRLCFCKLDETLEAAALRLLKLRSFVNK